MVNIVKVKRKLEPFHVRIKCMFIFSFMFPNHGLKKSYKKETYVENMVWN